MLQATYHCLKSARHCAVLHFNKKTFSINVTQVAGKTCSCSYRTLFDDRRYQAFIKLRHISIVTGSRFLWACIYRLLIGENLYYFCLNQMYSENLSYQLFVRTRTQYFDFKVSNKSEMQFQYIMCLDFMFLHMLIN
jgi:hypothetical protein